MLNPFEKKRGGEKRTTNFGKFLDLVMTQSFPPNLVIEPIKMLFSRKKFTCQIWKASRVERNLTGCTPFDPSGSGPSTNVLNRRAEEVARCVSCRAPGCPERCSRTWPPRTVAPPPPSTPWSRDSSLSNYVHSLIHQRGLRFGMKKLIRLQMVFLLQQRSSGAVIASF